MFKQLVINDFEHETRVALVEDGTIAELFIERHDESDIAGNIYKGLVKRVLPGMQAAFVDIGLQQAAFIYVNDLVHDDLNEFEKVFLTESEEIPEDEEENGQIRELPNYKNDIQIEEMIVEGQEVIVPGCQGAHRHQRGAGHRIHFPSGKVSRADAQRQTYRSISQNRRRNERKRLRKLVQEIKNDDYGYIVRTAAEGVKAEKLLSEMSFLNNLWNNILKKYKHCSPTKLIHKELTVSLRAVRDLLTHEVEKLIIDSRSGYESIVSFLDNFMPSLKDSWNITKASNPCSTPTISKATSAGP